MQPKNEKDALFLRALRHYYEREGHFFVPTDYVVPTPTDSDHADATNDALAWPSDLHGLPLGLRVRNFSRGISNKYKRAMLKRIGFPYDDWKMYVWEEQLVPALRVFAEIEGHTFVRFPFVVPVGDERYPRCTWGFKLGFSVALVRQQREAITTEQLQFLESMDFIWTENHYKLKILLLPALRQFKENIGHTVVPAKYIIPHDPDEQVWEKAVQDTKIGYLYTCLMNGFFDEETIADCNDDLQELGVFDPEQGNRVWGDRILPALLAFPASFGHADIPVDFVVPSTNSWPTTCWGLRLGYVVEGILQDGMYADQVGASKATLRVAGYRWSALFGKLARQLLPALRCFRELYGHADVPNTFVTPANDDRWPAECRKYHLGRQLQLLRKGGRSAPDIQDAIDELDALGFKFDLVDSDFREKILPAFEAYFAIHGHCDVPRGFVVPNDPAWPEKTHGVKLGTAASAIRSRKQYRKQIEEHREQLLRLGFSCVVVQSTATIEREFVQPCIAVYRELHGHETIPSDFVVPSNDPQWPNEAWGFRLGKWLVTHQRRRPRHDGTDSRDLGQRGALASTSTSPASPSSAPAALEPHLEQYWRDVLLSSFEAYAALHGSCEDMGDNFVVPSEPPYPQIAWGLNLGLRIRYIRHHDRYAAEVDKYREDLARLGVLRSP